MAARRIFIASTFVLIGLSAVPGMAAPTDALRVSVRDDASTSQRDRLEEKLALTRRILEHVNADATMKGATPEWREGLAASLYGLSNETLRRIEPTLTTLDEAHTAAASPQAAREKALGDAGNDLVFTPITPCRFIDTRNVGGAISSVRVFDTASPGSTYGGAAGCALSGIGEPAVALNVTVTGMTAQGYLIVRPQGSVNTTSFINWDNGAGQLANAGIIATTLANNGHYEFEITGNKGTPQVIVDFFGYFSAPAGTITGNGGAGDGVAGITSGAFNSGVYGKNTGGGKGVFGVSATGVAVAGQSTSGTGAAGNSSTGSGVYGQTAGKSGQSGAAGVWGDTHDYYGVWGTSVAGDGVHGNSGGAGVWGESTGYDGLHGHTSNPAGNASGAAGFGDGANSGVSGFSGTGNGVQGLSSGGAASGVYGHNTSGYGVYGRSDSGYAIGTDGPTFQARNQPGLIKALLDVDPQNERIVRCFNSQRPANTASIPPCGFTLQEPAAGQVVVDFGFQVNDRFFSALPFSAGSNGHIGVNMGICGGSPTVFCGPSFPTSSSVLFTIFDGDGNTPNAELHVVVF
ncbi:MAG: hypothetical protein ABI846_00585 [Rudaea sp.]